MNWADYLIPVSHLAGKKGFFGDMMLVYNGEPDFKIPVSTRVAIIGVPEDRFSDGAGEIKSPSAIRRQLYALSAGSQGTVVDLGNLRTGKNLADTYFGLRDVLAELYGRNIVTLIIGGTIDVFYGNCLAMKDQKINLTTIAPQIRLPVRGAENHPLNTLVFDQPENLQGDRKDTPLQKSLHFCNIGYQSYYVPQQDLDDFSDKHFEAYRLGEVRQGNLHGIEPVIRDSDMLAISMDVVKHADAPAASIASPNGFTGEEICQLVFFAGLSHKCQSLGIFDMIPQNDLQDITAKLAAQMVWYFIEGVKKRNIDNPKDHAHNFKKYLIYFDQLHHNLCFYKNIQTERWWMEVPSISNENENLMISCTSEDYTKAAEQEIPDRWWKTYQRIN
jgi:arginase family enzyme